MPKLVVISGPTMGLEHLFRGDMILGRDPKCQVVSSDREVSAKHARITSIGGRYFLEDLNSRNGTFLNGRRIQRQTIIDGDEIRIGRITYSLSSRESVQSSMTSTDSGSMTVELDATKDVFCLTAPQKLGPRRPMEQILKLLCDISRSIGALAGLKVTVDEIAATLLEVFPQCGRVIVLLTSDGLSLEPVAVRWRSKPGQTGATYSETIVRKAKAERRAILTVDASSDTRFSASRSVVDLNLRAVMCAPIVHRDQVLGVVELDTQESSRMFIEADLNLLTGIVAQLAFAVANAQLYEELSGIVNSTVSTLTGLLGAKCPSALAHSERVSRYSAMMARRLDFSVREIDKIRIAGLLHDIGLLSIPDSALQSSDLSTAHALPYDEANQAEMEPEVRAMFSAHPEKAAELLQPIKPLAGVMDIIMSHHEHYNGAGYPRGLIGEQIPYAGRILAVADGFDLAQVRFSDRENPSESALSYLRTHSGNRFDPKLVVLFAEIWSARQRLESRRQPSAGPIGT